LRIAPNECCGLVAAEDGVAKQVYRVKNAYKYPSAGCATRWGQTLLASLSKSTTQGGSRRDLPLAPAHRSPTVADRHQSRLPPKTTQPLMARHALHHHRVPCGRADPEVRAYRIDADGVEEVALSVQ
jgi:hypothetical protein